MSSQFQNRLVGIIVLVALGVIFLPDILDGKKQHQEEQFAEIPLRPDIKVEPLPQNEFETVELGETENQPSDASADNASANNVQDNNVQDNNGAGEWKIVTNETEVVEQASRQLSAEKPKPEVKQEPVKAKPQVAKASAYTLQLGSFNNANNVKALVKQLRTKGFTAYTIPETPVDGQLTKVFVGPDLSRVKLEKVQKQVEQVTKLKGRVIAYNPVER
ncbi:cell division protein DedD [Shewanella waksmanii]|uniref:cell division protein DedD n=1 Tax=Shewanella waksmanii TaxID=213783 RepID=UPI003734E642